MSAAASRVGIVRLWHGCHREPDPQLAVRRADAPLQVRRRRHHQRDRRRPPDQLVLRPDRQRRRRRASSSCSTPSGRRTASRRTSSSTASAQRVGAVAPGRLRRRHADHRPPAGVLDRSRPREAAVLLPDRSARNGDLHHRGRAESTATPGSRTTCARRTTRRTPACRAWRFKMATGTGKTVVMAMLIAWQTLNKLANPQDARFSDTFLIVTPGITIRDRLRVLLPNDPENYYRQRDIVPPDLLGRARAGARSSSPTSTPSTAARTGDAGKLTKAILADGRAEPVHRNARPDGPPRLPRAGQQEEHRRHQRRGPPLLPPQARRPRTRTLTGDERAGSREARRRSPHLDLRPRGGQEQDRRQGHLRPLGHAVLPARLRLPGRHALPVGRLRLLADRRHRGRHRQGAARAGRRRRDDRRPADLPRPLAAHPRGPAEEGPQDRRGRRRAEAARGTARALHSLYGNYEKYYRPLGAERRRPGPRPHAAGVHRRLQQHQRLQAGLRLHRRLGEARSATARRSSCPAQLPLFSNDDGTAAGSHRPNTILVDSEQLESGEAMSDDFKKIAAARDRGVQGRVPRAVPRPRRRRPHRRRPAARSDEHRRQGRQARRARQVRRVSVSMLTEGWDANTVTHILGVRAFGTQLLCEQVVGRGLRRMSYAVERRRPLRRPSTPRSTACRSRSSRARGATADPKPGPMPTRVRALEDRIACEITFPAPARLPLRRCRASG